MWGVESAFGAGCLRWMVMVAGLAGVVAGTVGTVPGRKLNGGSVVAWLGLAIIFQCVWGRCNCIPVLVSTVSLSQR